jgi:hypothetical protein
MEWCVGMEWFPLDVLPFRLRLPLKCGEGLDLFS